MKFTKIPETAFQELQLNAGILLSSFTPSTATVTAENILGATSGGVNFTATPTYSDFGEDIDNCPKNMLELKKLDFWEVKMSGTFVTVDTSLAKTLIGAADIGTSDTTQIIPLYRSVVGWRLLRQERRHKRRLCSNPHAEWSVYWRLPDSEWR